jgi:ribosomal-protein-alanine N-acetyltransferase
MEPPPDLPELLADDYLLRRWELSDLPAVREAATDPYIPLTTTVPADYSRAAAEAYVRRQWGRPATGQAPFAIARAGDGRAVGHATLRTIGPDRAAVGYWVLPSARGAGAAGSALRALTAWGLGELRIARLELYVEPWNAGSRRTAESAGYEREGLLRDWQRMGGELKDMVMYSTLRRRP